MLPTGMFPGNENVPRKMMSRGDALNGDVLKRIMLSGDVPNGDIPKRMISSGDAFNEDIPTITTIQLEKSEKTNSP